MRRRVTGLDRKDSSAITPAAGAQPVVDDRVCRLFFEPAHYTVFENVGEFAVSICRDGPLDCQVAVHVQTEDGTANAGTDYIHVDTQVMFAPGEDRKEVSLNKLIHIGLGIRLFPSSRLDVSSSPPWEGFNQSKVKLSILTEK